MGERLIEQAPWLHFAGISVLARAVISPESLAFQVTDTVDAWSVSMDGARILATSKALNPKFELAPASVLQSLTDYLCTCSAEAKYRFERRQNGDAAFSFKASVFGFAYTWEMQLHPAPRLFASRSLTHPLLLLAAEYQRRISNLIEIVQKKERELDEIRALSGGGGRGEARRFNAEVWAAEQLANASFVHDDTRAMVVAARTLTSPMYLEVVRALHLAEDQAAARELQQLPQPSGPTSLDVDSPLMPNPAARAPSALAASVTRAAAAETGGSATRAPEDDQGEEERQRRRREQLRQKIEEEQRKKTEKARKTATKGKGLL